MHPGCALCIVFSQEATGSLLTWSGVYLAVVLGVAVLVFGRRDL